MYAGDELKAEPVADVPLPADDEDAGLSVLPSAAAPGAAGAAAEDKDEKQRIIEALKATKGRIYGVRGALVRHASGAVAFPYAGAWMEAASG